MCDGRFGREWRYRLLAAVLWSVLCSSRQRWGQRRSWPDAPHTYAPHFPLRTEGRHVGTSALHVNIINFAPWYLRQELLEVNRNYTITPSSIKRSADGWDVLPSTRGLSALPSPPALNRGPRQTIKIAFLTQNLRFHKVRFQNDGSSRTRRRWWRASLQSDSYEERVRWGEPTEVPITGVETST